MAPPREHGDGGPGVVGVVQRVGHRRHAAGDHPGDILEDAETMIDDDRPEEDAVADVLRAVVVMMTMRNMSGEFKPNYRS